MLVNLACLSFFLMLLVVLLVLAQLYEHNVFIQEDQDTALRLANAMSNSLKGRPVQVQNFLLVESKMNGTRKMDK